MALKREHSPSSDIVLPSIFRSEQIKHETSAFIGAFSPTLSPKALQALPEFRTATHRMVAWRTRSKQKSLTPDSKVLAWRHCTWLAMASGTGQKINNGLRMSWTF